MEQDVRWMQRFSNYKKALDKLYQAVTYITNADMPAEHILSEIINEGLVQRFEYTHELAWNVMKDYAAFQGNNLIGGSRDATREALNLKIIDNGDLWMDMIRSRNETSHTYNSDITDVIMQKIVKEYYPQFVIFKNTMEEKCNLV